MRPLPRIFGCLSGVRPHIVRSVLSAYVGLSEGFRTTAPCGMMPRARVPSSESSREGNRGERYECACRRLYGDLAAASGWARLVSAPATFALPCRTGVGDGPNERSGRCRTGLAVSLRADLSTCGKRRLCWPSQPEWRASLCWWLGDRDSRPGFCSCQSWRHAALVAGPCSKHFPRGRGVEQLICLIDVTPRFLNLTGPARVVRPANQDLGIVQLRAGQPASVSGRDAL